MNFTTFTGSSRRPRNVNLSGQPSNPNPFASSSWNRPGDPSRTVVQAQAERQKRQEKRELLQSAKLVQRVYRGNVARATTRDMRRAQFDQLYRESPITGVKEVAAMRVDQALPHLIRSFRLSNKQDAERLSRLCYDLEAAGLAALSGQAPFRKVQFLGHLLDVLDVMLPTESLPEAPLYLRAVVAVVRDYAGEVLVPSTTDRLYSMLGRLSSRPDLDLLWKDATIEGIRAPFEAFPPLKGDPTAISDARRNAYRAFAFEFLATPNLLLLENDCSRFLDSLDLVDLTAVIMSDAPEALRKASSADSLLWLLAHLIHIYTSATDYKPDTILGPLYVLLSSLGKEIRPRLAASTSHEDSYDHGSEDSDESAATPLPDYVKAQLQSLVSTDSIENILGQLSDQRHAAETTETATLVSGYLLALLSYFPEQSDTIRMRLFLSDIPSASGKTVPALHWLWQSVAKSRIFFQGWNDTRAPVSILKAYLSQQPGLQPHDGDAEWRVLLLFLDLYIFVLRLADDDDFLGAIKPSLSDAPSRSRIQTCCLSLEIVQRLTVFLKNFSFALYHDMSAILPSSTLASESAEIGRSGLAMAVTTRLDLDGLKNIITTAMQLLYERDSRLQFLPSDHWLMTSRFNMEGFIADVVEELQRQQEADDEPEEEDDEEPVQVYAEPSRSQLQERRQKAQRDLAKKQRDRQLAKIGPRLEILKHMPFVIPFETRVKIFKQFIHLDKIRRREGLVDADQWRLQQRATQAQTGMNILGRHSAEIRRTRELLDAYDQFYPLGSGLKEPINITFIDRFGEVEAGIDGGGVTKEFLTSVIGNAFEDDDAWFKRNAEGLHYPNPGVMDWFREKLSRCAQEGEDEGDLLEKRAEIPKIYEFLGRLMGKCLYEEILVDIAFTGFFLMKWRMAGEQNRYRGTVNDLRDLDEGLYKGLMKLKNERSDVSAWDMYFTIDDEASFNGQKFVVTRNLVRDGDKKKVTNDNRLLFISSVARHRLVSQPATQTNAFIHGLRSIIEPSWLSMFNQVELQRLVGGDSMQIDVEDLRRNTIYGGLYVVGDDGLEHDTVRMFWRVMAGLEDKQRRQVLKFVTSTPRAPLLGFSQLSPRFSIRDGGPEGDRLPSASTCVNLLKLPLYRDEQTLREKLLLAVFSGAGFDLS